MIGPLDTFTLARTKLRSKRILLIVTIIISGLLFGVLVGALIITAGATRSVTQFFETAQHGRYLVEAQPFVPPSALKLPSTFEPPSKAQIDELQAIEKEIIAKQKMLFQQQKLPFDPALIPPILTANPFGSRDENGTIFKTVNQESPAYAEYAKRQLQKYIATAPNTIAKLTERAKRYGATATYSTERVGTQAGTLTYLADGKEHLDKKPGSPQPSGNDDPRATSVTQASYTLADRELIERFILPPNDKRNASPTAVPVIISSAETTKLFGKQLGIAPKPKNVADQAAWYKTLYQKANGHTYTYCYRSHSETELIQQTMRTNTDLVEKKNDPSYEPPALQYNLPTETCAPLTVKKDTRTAEQKLIDAKQETIKKELGTYQPLERKLLTFQIVGVFNMSDMMMSDGPTSFISFLFGPSFYDGGFIPKQLYAALPPDPMRDAILTHGTRSLDDQQGQLEAAGIKPAISSFTSVEAAREFIKRESCDMSSGDIRNCTKGVFMNTYGTNYLAVDEFGAFISQYFPFALAAIMAIATIIIWVTMARVIIDSRRETAVFRALGAKRRDIASVYLTYSLLVASMIILFAAALGLGLALIAEHFISAPATALAQVAYGTFDATAPSFHVIGFDIPLLALLAGSIILISLVAVTPPLIRNVRRSPIRDMRDE